MAGESGEHEDEELYPSCGFTQAIRKSSFTFSCDGFYFCANFEIIATPPVVRMHFIEEIIGCRRKGFRFLDLKGLKNGENYLHHSSWRRIGGISRAQKMLETLHQLVNDKF